MRIYTKPEKVRFAHIDNAGIVFYPRFLEMLNGLVEDWFEEKLDLSFAAMHKTHGIPTVDLKVQFKKPARLGETLTKSLWVKEMDLRLFVDSVLKMKKEKPISKVR